LAGPVCAAAFVDRVARPTFVGTETSVRDCRITSIDVRDVRFPTSRTLAGSDAMNEAPDYSAAYVILETDTDLRGYGMTFTCGRGTGRKLVPTVGESENGFRDTMASHQVQGISYGSPPYTGAYALKEAVAILQGHRMPKLMQVPLPLNTAGQLKKCTDVTKGCNAFPPSKAPSTGFFDDFYEKELAPELCLSAATSGRPCPGKRARPPTGHSFPSNATTRA
jgi:hypothetical protein